MFIIVYYYDFKDKNQEVIDSWNESSKLCYENTEYSDA